jgi:antitoxin component YwqK of YwqJK toxin-antitoxin module
VTDPSEPVAHLEHYANGKIKLAGAHLDGEMHGPWEFYRLDGSLMRTGSFDRGRQVGPWRTFDRAGQMVKETDLGAEPPGA